MEEGGLATAPESVGLTRARRIGHADEPRLGPRGTTRRVRGRRGVTARQPLRLTYDRWCPFATVEASLEELDADPARVRRLRGWDRVDAAIATLPESLENPA